MRRLGTFGILVFLGAFALSSRATEPVSLSKSPQVFSFRVITEPETLDWNRAHTPIETYFLNNLMEGLVSLDGHLQVRPALARSWGLSPDGKTYTFSLRSDARWSDGKKLVAQDFVTSWRRLLTPATAAPYAYLLYDIVGAEEFNRGVLQDFSQVGIRVLNDQTLQVQLKVRLNHWISIPSFWVTFPMRQDLLDRWGESWTLPGKLVTLGPYQLESYQLASKIVLRANPYYEGPRGNLDRLIGWVIQDDSTALSLFESGRLDFMTDIPGPDLLRLQKTPEFKIFPYLKTVYLGFVTTREPTSNPHLRRAIAMAIDKSQIKNFLHGGQEPATSWVPPPLLGSSKNLGLPYNLKKAKEELMAWQVKLPRSAENPPSIDLLVINSDKSLTVGQFIQEELKKNLDLRVTLQAFDSKTFRGKVDLRVFPQYLLSWSADYPDPDNFLSVFLSTSGNNRTGWPEKGSPFDAEVTAARQALRAVKREQIYFHLQKSLLEEHAVVVPLYYEPNLALVNSRVQNLELNPINYLDLKRVNLVPKN